MYNKQEYFKTIEKIFADGMSLLEEKNDLYGDNDLSFANFKKTASLLGISKEEALWGMCAKHVVAVSDNIKDDKVPFYKKRESLIDIMNYCAILIAMGIEREDIALDARKLKTEVAPDKA